jgi:hypothetical protein
MSVIQSALQKSIFGCVKPHVSTKSQAPRVHRGHQGEILLTVSAQLGGAPVSMRANMIVVAVVVERASRSGIRKHLMKMGIASSQAGRRGTGQILVVKIFYQHRPLLRRKITNVGWQVVVQRHEASLEEKHSRP